MMHPAQAPQKKGFPVWLVILLVVGVAGVPTIGVMATVAIYGVRQYLVQAKKAEGRSGAMSLARGLASCAETTGHLPPTSASVPPTVPVATKVQTSPADWNDVAYTCAHFSMSAPQYFQYQWVATSATRGVARATADFGSGPVTITAEVTCTASGAALACTPGLPIEGATTTSSVP